MTFDEILAKIAASIRDGFVAVVQDISDSALLGQIEAAIEAGDFGKVFRLLGIVPGTFRPLLRAIEQSFEDGAAWIAQTYPKYVNTPDGKGVFRFNVRDPRAETWLRNKSASLVTSITEEMRQSIRTAMDGGMLSGRGPKNVALDIVGRYDRVEGRRVGGIIGLTTQQEGWVASTRRQLETLDAGYFTKDLRDRRFDPIVRKAIDNGRRLSREDIDKIVGRYADRTLRYRGETIARVESMEALAASDYESTRQVVAMGAARPKDVTREWDTAGDEKVRHSHAEMDGQVVGLEEAFVSPVSGARMMYPHDSSLGAPANEIIGCRCRARNKIDWIGAALND